MNIGMILDNEFTGDMRVENEVISLTKAGFNIFVLCFNFGKKQEFENFDGAKIIRLKINVKLKNKMKGLTNTFFDPYTKYWANQIITFVKKYKIDTLHIHDLYLLGAAFKAKKKLRSKIPIVGDLHENYPEALKHYKFSNTFPGNLIISIPKWERVEIEWVNKADEVITVIEEAVERYTRLGIHKKNLTVVANYVNSDVFLNSEFDESIFKKFEGNFVISYLGGFDSHRGLECAIKAIPFVKELIPNIKLVLVGTGRNEEDLKRLAHSLKIDGLVVFEGWQLPKVLPSYIKASNLCLIPHLKTAHTDNTIPHKLFQYMLLEKPVISTNCNPLERILKESEAGFIYSSNNEKELASCILQAYQNPELINKMGKNGKRMVQEKYNWETTAKSLIQLYQKLSKKNKAGEKLPET